MTRSVCIVEPDHRGEYRDDRPDYWRENMVPMIHIGCQRDKGQDPLKWIDAHFEKELPIVRRVWQSGLPIWVGLGALGTREFIDCDWSREHPDKEAPARQVARVVELLRSVGIPRVAGLFVCHEQEWKQRSGKDHARERAERAKWFRAVLGDHIGPRGFFGDVALWNFVNPHRAAPAELWWGKVKPGTVTGTSNVQIYGGWYDPSQPEKARLETLTLEAMAKHALQAVRNYATCSRMGRCILHAPVCHPDLATARQITQDILISCRVHGRQPLTVIWAAYMTDTFKRPGYKNDTDVRPGMSYTISNTLAYADAMAEAMEIA